MSPAAGPVGRSALSRYAPVLVLAALVLAIQTIAPSGANSVSGASGAAGAAGGGRSSAASPGAGSAGGSGGVLGSSGASGSGAGPDAVGVGAPAGSGFGGSGSSTGGTATAGPATISGQQVDPLGRPLSGDRSRCAPGGLLQDNVTTTPQPCIPALAGSNGGATYEGVTSDTITMVVVYPDYGQATDAALNQVQLEMTPSQQQQVDAVFDAFINTHWNLYGRKLQVYSYNTGDSTTDAVAMRADAKAVIAKWHPFMVSWYVPNIMPEEFADQLTQAGVVALGPGLASNHWFQQHAPLAWDYDAPAATMVDMAAEYYCKRMYGRNATLAGDPTMRVKKRKLGILSGDRSSDIEVAQQFLHDVTGGVCGTPTDATIYTESTDSTTQKNEAPSLATRMKNDGITTVAGEFGDNLCGAADQQGYYPENLVTGQSDQDDDLVAQLSGATCSQKQLDDAFGIGFYPPAQPRANDEDVHVAHAVDPSYTPPYLAKGPWQMFELAGRLLQWAGPHLTPQTIEAGAKSAPQLGGYANPDPWPGWQSECCNVEGPEWNFTPPGKFGAVADARVIYWSSTTTSPDDGAPGAWVCPGNDCRRYPSGQLPRGDAP